VKLEVAQLAEHIETFMTSEESAAAAFRLLLSAILVFTHKEVGKTIEFVITRAQMAGIQVILMIMDSKL